MEAENAQLRAVDLARPARGLRVVHAPAPAHPLAPGELRRAALESNGGPAQPCDPSRLWSALCSGRLRVAELFQLEQRTLVIFESRAPEARARSAIHGRRRDVLERTLRGQSGKSIAVDFHLSASTISIELNKALRSVGLKPRRSGVPMFLVQLCHAASHAASLDASLSGFELGARSFVALSISPPDYSPLNQLAKAELEVCRLLLEGCSHAQIARTRGTKLRTTANQISAIFQKLRVSGRMALLAELIGKREAPDSDALTRSTLPLHAATSPRAEVPASSGAMGPVVAVVPPPPDLLEFMELRSTEASRGRFDELCAPARNALRR